MNFKIDENLPVEISEVLNKDGHEAATVIKQNLQGASDTRIAEVCNKEKRILVTMDSDFADIRTYPPENHNGIIVLRLNRQDKISVINIFQHVMSLLDKETIEKRLWVVEEHRIRIRE